MTTLANETKTVRVITSSEDGSLRTVRMASQATAQEGANASARWSKITCRWSKITC